MRQLPSQTSQPTESGPLILVNEIFGPTFQGEGPSLGRLAFFLRLGTCNLHCTWCDTKYTWDWANYDPQKELMRMSVDQIVEDLGHAREQLPDDYWYPLLVISGGEPLIQRKKLLSLGLALLREHWDIEIETNGTFLPIDVLGGPTVRYNVSPKLLHSGNSPGESLNIEALRAFVYGRNAWFKFVCNEVDDLMEVAQIAYAAGIPPNRIYIMPQAQDNVSLQAGSARLANEVLHRGWNMTTRLHIQLWGATRGR